MSGAVLFASEIRFPEPDSANAKITPTRMYWSKLFIPTLRENPAHAQSDTHRRLMRAGYLRRGRQGSHCYLPAAQRTLLKIAAIVREEMQSAGAQEFVFEDVLPLSSAIEDIAQELQSYREFPQIWYQIQNRSALDASLFQLQQSFSLSLSPDSSEQIQDQHWRAYARILERCGVPYLDAGSDFMMKSDTGDDFLVLGGDYAAGLETAKSIPSPPSVPDPEDGFSPEAFSTPGIKTIGELAAFTGLPETSFIKTLVLISRDEPVMALLRGDHQLSETKLAQALGSPHIGPAHPDRIKQWLGADPGSLGPVGVSNMPVLIDEALRGRRNMIAGANRTDFHLRNVTALEDFEGRFADLRQVAPGDISITDGSPLRIEKALRLASLRSLGGGYGDPARPMFLGHYCLWLERILLAAAESCHDNDGLTIAAAIAPFDVVIVPIDFALDELRRASEQIYSDARAAGLDALLDDRPLRAGPKFKDADLVGIPYRITVGKKLAEGMVEVVSRSPKRSADVPAGEAVQSILDAHQK